MRGLTGQVVVITGAGSGIGRATALRFAEEGAVVAVNDLDEAAAEETVALVRADGGEAASFPADVTDYDAVTAMVAAVVDHFGTLDVLVNNAGWDQMEWFVQQDPAVWRDIVDVNLFGQVYCSRAVAEYLIERGEGGTIVNVSSDAARVGTSGEAVYTAAKGGVISFTKTIARELARDDITCNVVAPGLTRTPLLDRNLEESDMAAKLIDGLERHIPLRRPAEPDDIAAAIAFFASTDAEYITGQVLSVNGGASMA